MVMNKHGGKRRNSGPLSYEHSRHFLSFRCSARDWQTIKMWHCGDAEQRAQDILKIMRNK